MQEIKFSKTYWHGKVPSVLFCPIFDRTKYYSTLLQNESFVSSVQTQNLGEMRLREIEYGGAKEIRRKIYFEKNIHWTKFQLPIFSDIVECLVEELVVQGISNLFQLISLNYFKSC